jgi:hydrogenase maturation protease
MPIICCGTAYRGDDGAGLLVADRLHQLNVSLHVHRRSYRSAAGHGRAEEVLIVDALITGAPAGTVSEWYDGAAELQHNSSTSHALGVAEGIALARGLEKLPTRLHIYSVEARTFEIGREMSSEVRRAADELAKFIATLMAEWRPNIAVRQL